MKNTVYKICLIAVLITLSFGQSMAQGGQGVAITNASFKAPTPERENLNGEWVEITNHGMEAQDMDGWTLSDQQNHVYKFMSFTLASNASVKVHSGTGADTATDVFWNSNQSIWNNDGDVATLKDEAQNVISVWP